MKVDKLKYGAQSLLKKFNKKYSFCPSCGSRDYVILDDKAFRKFPTSLRRCQACKLQYRHPITLEEESKKFYEAEYIQSGLTTDLPSDEVLEDLIKSRFKGSEKDFRAWFPLFRKISDKLGRAISILDYGANWGYTVFQLNSQDFVSQCVGYEYSSRMVEFGEDKLSISYFNPKRDDYTFDVVFSSHVIEHMHNPAILKEHMDLFLAEDGFLILTCPNGSMSRLFNDPEGWRKHWGSVHPNHISDEYLVELFKEYKGAVFEERLTEEMFSEWINSCEYPVASHFPATGNLVALFCKSKLKN